MEARCEYPAMDIHVCSVSEASRNCPNNMLKMEFSSAVLIISGWLTLISGLLVQHEYHRSISLKSLWAMGFGETNTDEIVSWNQATEVGSNPLGIQVLPLTFNCEDRGKWACS